MSPTNYSTDTAKFFSELSQTFNQLNTAKGNYKSNQLMVRDFDKNAITFKSMGIESINRAHLNGGKINIKGSRLDRLKIKNDGGISGHIRNLSGGST